jgi:hypothetical protein
MSRRANPGAALEASARQLRQDLRTAIPTSRTGETRTTYSISDNARHALQLLAVEQKCKLNDLVALAIEDFLAKHSSLPVEPTRQSLRNRLLKQDASHG